MHLLFKKGRIASSQPWSHVIYLRACHLDPGALADTCVSFVDSRRTCFSEQISRLIDVVCGMLSTCTAAVTVANTCTCPDGRHQDWDGLSSRCRRIWQVCRCHKCWLNTYHPTICPAATTTHLQIKTNHRVSKLTSFDLDWNDAHCERNLFQVYSLLVKHTITWISTHSHASLENNLFQKEMYGNKPWK